MTQQEFGQAYEKGFSKTMQFLMSTGIPEERAEEAAQAGWVRGWERRDQLRQPAKIVSWVNKISLNFFRNVLRRERPTDESSGLVALPSVSARTLDVRRVLEKCDAADRRLLTDYYLSGYTSGEISRDQDCSPEAIRIRVMRAKQRFMRYLGSEPYRDLAA